MRIRLLELMKSNFYTNSGLKVGKVTDIFFDDIAWVLRYFVIDTGTWFNGHEVVISPQAIAVINKNRTKIETQLSEENIKQAPLKESHKLISKHYEEKLTHYYGWPKYWGDVIEPRTGFNSNGQNKPAKNSQKSTGTPYLRSFLEVKKYAVSAKDGNVGHIEDLLINPTTWEIEQVLIDTRNWLPGKHVVIDIGSIGKIEWETHHVTFNLTKDQIKYSPEFDGKQDPHNVIKLTNKRNSKEFLEQKEVPLMRPREDRTY